ncbi:MAG: prepilin-type N-terminal cleavage/methylation domain-containing protein [Actinomycetota bacterium]|nr:prepilin-type N-terminal cleavage/methylation domain-containing protein [Actinomycetota bacterium]
MVRLRKDEAGYSLVEVMASIVILTVAIIPMVSMFDMGLNVASRGSNYDTARAFANQKLEQAESLSYNGVRNNFPRTGDGTPTVGTPSSIDKTTEAGVPDGFSYGITKRFKCVSGSPSGCTPPTGATSFLSNASADTGIVETTVTVSWGANKSITVAGIKSR